MNYQPINSVFIKIIACLIILVFFAGQTYSQDDGRVVKIPVVFHVLYGDKMQDNGINIESRENGNNTMYLPKEKIEAELADLDADFQNLNTDLTTVRSEFKKVIGNPKVRFYLSDIKYVEVNKRDIRRPSTNTDLLHRLSPIVNSKKFLNVYISEIKFEGDFTNGLTPVKTSENYGDGFDVVNLNYKWVGLKYRLLTHEVGHWLGLWHTWDESQLDDGIDDIPLQKTFTDVDCDKCPPEVKDRITRKSRKRGFVESNYNNFMDYSGCRSMFSAKQTQQMRKVIRLYRAEIWNSRE